ncbi:glycosyltransferase [Limosilactobacillus gastricus]|nr:glycosyltransferase [Limosilactobacillus gastricus]QGF40720.1 glycosyltransferase [Limosilactobacillus gastricus]
MIFVTVGTHEQPFNRLIEKVDQLVGNGVIQEKVIMQTGYCTYQPLHCEAKSMLDYNKMKDYINQAHIVITHGGPASFIEVLQAGKIPVVVPRLATNNEHVNDHQVDFLKMVDERMHNVIPVYDIENLSNVIEHYDELVKNMSAISSGNNARFNQYFEQIVNRLVGR